jgi:hypothetical protein
MVRTLVTDRVAVAELADAVIGNQRKPGAICIEPTQWFVNQQNVAILALALCNRMLRTAIGTHKASVDLRRSIGFLKCLLDSTLMGANKEEVSVICTSCRMRLGCGRSCDPLVAPIKGNKIAHSHRVWRRWHTACHFRRTAGFRNGRHDQCGRRIISKFGIASSNTFCFERKF